MYVVLSKLFWFVAAPSSLLAFLALGGVISLILTRRRRGLWPLAVCAVSLGLLWLLPVGEWALLPLEGRFPPPQLPERVDGILVSGDSVAIRQSVAHQQVQLASGSQLPGAAALARRYPSARIVLTGGEPWITHSGKSGAELGHELLVSLGVAPGRIAIETKARNKFENAHASHDLAHPQQGEIWLVVASAYQMPRLMGAYRRAGWVDLIAYPTGYQSPKFSMMPAFNMPLQLQRLDLAVREWLGLAVYWALDRSNALYPGAEPPMPKCDPCLLTASRAP